MEAVIERLRILPPRAKLVTSVYSVMANAGSKYRKNGIMFKAFFKASKEVLVMGVKTHVFLSLQSNNIMLLACLK